jgi:major vault protein
MAQEPKSRETRELALPPGSYVYTQDVMKGGIKVYVGPTVVNPTGQEVPIIFDAGTGQFRQCDSLEEARRGCPGAEEGYYIILSNPSIDEKEEHPVPNTQRFSAELSLGRRVVIPGPTSFALWPQQLAKVVQGHHLRSNQYLLVRIYNEEQAKKKWTTGVVKPATLGGEVATSTPSSAPEDLTIGKLIIIPGTQVSFYIPPTGVEVVEADGKYVREALTLERLEYAILVDENGKKRFEKGPQVVFPKPTETFLEMPDDKGKLTKKFRAIDLNEISGIYVKVIADYEEGEGDAKRKYKTGEELFITGKDTAIYYPREEHSIVKYDGQAKNFATAIPAGEARYVLIRNTGQIKKISGPAMLLPDPRTEVIVRRVLSDKQCQLWYPGDEEVLDYNRSLRIISKSSPTTRAGAVTEGEIARRMKSKSIGGQTLIASANYSSAAMEQSMVNRDQAVVGEEISRASTYTQPRTVTLDTKNQGAPSIDIPVGYAVLVVDASGKRRVVKGPATVLLEYDEDLETLTLSSGKPKTTDNLITAVRLRTDNNKVSDKMVVETYDHVRVEVYLSYRVTFDSSFEDRWFSVENYVKFLCDHVRSILKGSVRKLSIEEFYTNSTDIIRTLVLGLPSESGERPGMLFHENGMRVLDLEVLSVSIADENIKSILDKSQFDVVRTNVDLANAQRTLATTKIKQQIVKEEAEVLAAVQKRRDELSIDAAASSLVVSLSKISNALKENEQQQALDTKTIERQSINLEARLEAKDKEEQQLIKHLQAENDAKAEYHKAEAELLIAKMKAMEGPLTEALLALSNNEVLVKVAEATDVLRIAGGNSVVEVLSKIVAGSPLEATMHKLLGPPLVK